MKTNQLSLPILISTYFFIYIAYRANSVGFTIDESQSVFIAKATHPYDLINYTNGETNNHFLISLWLRHCILKFGYWQEWALRLPCVLAALFFIGYAWRTAKLIAPNYWTSIACFVLFLSNPFVDDFFSLARGYGLGIAFQMVSMFYFIRFLQVLQPKDMLKTMLFAAIATLGHFMLLNYFLTLFGLCFMAVMWLIYYENFKSWKLTLFYWATIAASLAYYLQTPFKNIIKTKPSNYGDYNGFVADTFQSLIRSSYSGAHDMGDTPLLWSIIYGLLGLTLLKGCLVMIDWLRDKHSLQKLSLLAGIAIFIGMAVVVTLLNVLYQQPFPVTRMTISFFLPMSITLAAGLNAIKNEKISKIWAISLGILASIGFFRAANLSYTIEWAGHALDRDMIAWIANHERNQKNEKQYSIASDSYFAPGIHYYTEKEKLKWIKELSQFLSPDLTKTSDYLVIYSKDRNSVDTSIYQKMTLLTSNEYMAWNADIMIYKKKE
jgi:hypothetical protein